LAAALSLAAGSRVTAVAGRADAAQPQCVDCDRQARKVFEALQAWRRMHGGCYPPSLEALVDDGLTDARSIRCPSTIKEYRDASNVHPLSKSQGEGRDPAGAYEYELSSVVDPATEHFMGERISRGEVKAELLRRAAWEQVPVLRCSAHQAERPRLAEPSQTIFRNFTASGASYWSGEFWEIEWPETPEPCRQALVTRGMPGPPFHHGHPPSEPGEIDLRKFYNASGERAWWWGVRLMDYGGREIDAADLSDFLRDRSARSISLAGHRFWIDGLIQLQGKPVPDQAEDEAFRRIVFPWKTSPISVGSPVRLVRLLLGCVWSDVEGREVGRLIWNYADGSRQEAELLYGKDVRRFWKRGNEGELEPAPAFVSAAEPGRETRIYVAMLENPNPEQQVVSFELESSRESPAAPFILAITIEP
jgi:hypothetical protein